MTTGANVRDRAAVLGHGEARRVMVAGEKARGVLEAAAAIGIWMALCWPAGTAAQWREVPVNELGLSSASITAVHADPRGGLWVANDRGEVVYGDGQTWEDRSPDRGFGALSTLSDDGAGGLWAIRNGEEVWRYDGTGWAGFEGGVGVTIVDKRAEMPGDRHGMDCVGSEYSAEGDGVLHGVPFVPGDIQDLLVDGRGDLWIATDDVTAVLLFGSGSLHCWDNADLELRGIHTQVSMAEDAAGQIWALFAGYGLVRYAGGAWSREAAPIYPFLNGAVELTSGPDGSVLAVGLGVWRLQDGGFVDVLRPSGDNVWVLATEPLSGGAFWAVEVQVGRGRTGQAVVFVASDGAVSRLPYPHSDEMPGGRPFGVASTGDGRVWLGDTEGLFVAQHVPQPETPIRAQSWGETKRLMPQ